MRKFIPDDISLGAQLFFLSQTQIHLKQPEAAHKSLQECARTHWVDKKHNNYILNFSLAKLYQSQGMHQEAIGTFNKAIDLYPTISHTIFRRAWSYKVRFALHCTFSAYKSNVVYVYSLIIGIG